MGNGWLAPCTHSLGEIVSHHSGPSGFVPCTMGGRFILRVLGSVQFSHSVVSNYLRPHGLQQTRLPCPSPTPWACSDSCPSSWWCYLTISSSFCPLLLLPSICPSIRVFSKELALHIRWLNYWNFSFSISPSNEYSGLISFRMDWFDLLSVQGLSRVFSNTTVQKHQFFRAQLSSQSNSHPYMTTGKTIALTRWTFVGKVISLLFNMLSRLVIAFLPRSKSLLISWLQSSAVILEPSKIKSATVSPSICREVVGPYAMI